MPSIQESANLKDDKTAFETKVHVFLSDKRIVGYFSRKLVDRHAVIETLVEGAAFKEALETPAYGYFNDLRKKVQRKDQRRLELINSGKNIKAIVVILCTTLSLEALLADLFHARFVDSAILLLLVLLSASGAVILAHAFMWRRKRLLRILIALLALSSALVVVGLAHFLLSHSWEPVRESAVFIFAFVAGWLLASEPTLDDSVGLAVACWMWPSIIYLKSRRKLYQRDWLDECQEKIMMPHATLAINTILGEDKNKLLVEQDSEGLRRLQDPQFTVPTQSEARVTSILSQIDGGSIAVSGPRGAGKSTLLRRFTEPDRPQDMSQPSLPIYVTAPAEYVPRDFIAEVFQHLCKQYLIYCRLPVPQPIYKEKLARNSRKVIRRALAVCWLWGRTIAACAIIALAAWPFAKTAFPHVRASTLALLHHWENQALAQMRLWWKKHRLIVQIVVVVFALIILPFRSKWQRYLGQRKEPLLAQRAREYLSRLQVDKTVTWGSSLNSPSFRGLGIGVNRGGSLKYTPWTLPELVGHIRQFMQDVTKQFSSSSHAIIIGIDEVDRIGSVDHAEKFISEIKAIFGIERCFFLVAVAEDIGSLFAQRVTAGRSILENAFDDIVVVEPLRLEETRDLLLKRVPGFTDPFVYLVYALSGGLPRELIRVTRRLVDVNQELRSDDHYPRLEDLAYVLVGEELLEAMRAARNQMSRLRLGSHWTSVFDSMRSAGVALRRESLLSKHESYSVIKTLSEMVPPNPLRNDLLDSLNTQDEDSANSILSNLAILAYFGLTVIDAFSGGRFDAHFMKYGMLAGSEMSYEQLAAARVELNLSPASSRSMLQRFRELLPSVAE